MKQNWIRKRTPMLCLCVVLALLSGCAGQRNPSAADAESHERLEDSEPIADSNRSDSSEQSQLSGGEDLDLTGTTWFTTASVCTIEMNGKIGRIDGVTATGNLPIVSLTWGAPTSEESPVDHNVILEGESPLSIQMEDGHGFDLFVSNSLYGIGVEADKPAHIDVSEAEFSLKPTEPTDLGHCIYFIQKDGITIGNVTFSGTVENSLQITREDEGVYLVEGLSGAGFVKCEEEGADESCLDQKYQDGENRDFRLVWKDGAPTITAVES